MPISFTPIGIQKKWAGSAWTVDDEAELASLLAKVALGQSRDVARILHETNCTILKTSTTQFQGARKLLEVPDGQTSFHRDGWVFQVISWIAAHRQDRDALIRAPQMIWADKGFDGLFIRIDEQEHTVSAVVICEEKATASPRSKITSQVWPEFEELETGARDNELLAAVTLLLQACEEGDQMAADILWEKARAYRVSVTTSDDETDGKCHTRLFKGFEKIVAGGIDRRRAEVLHLDDVRVWLDQIANMALDCIDAMEMADV